MCGCCIISASCTRLRVDYGPMGRVGKYREGKYTDETESVAVDERPE